MEKMTTTNMTYEKCMAAFRETIAVANVIRIMNNIKLGMGLKRSRPH